jgi:hypothetical protein
LRAGVVVKLARVLTGVLLLASILWQPAPAFGLSGNGWHFSYELTDTDGLAVSGATFNGRYVFTRISVPQIRVHYSAHPTMNDQIGRSGNVPYVGGTTKVTRSASSISLSMSFRCCRWPSAASYRYDVRYTFYSSGKFVPVVYVYGPGLERTAVYQVFFRMDLAVGGAAADRFRQFSNGAWHQRSVEAPSWDDGVNQDGAEWAVTDPAAAWTHLVKPRTTDNNATVYVLRYHYGQGNQDLGPAVRLPTAYDTDETIIGRDLVEWYYSRATFHRPSGCPPTCREPIGIGPVVVQRAEPTPTLSPSPTPSESP